VKLILLNKLLKVSYLELKMPTGANVELSIQLETKWWLTAVILLGPTLLLLQWNRNTQSRLEPFIHSLPKLFLIVTRVVKVVLQEV